MSQESRFHPLSVEIPGPVWHEGVSHGLDYDHDLFLVKVVAVIDGHRIACAVRPMVGMEIIHNKLRGHSREEVLRAYGVTEIPELDEMILRDSQKPWWRFW